MWTKTKIASMVLGLTLVGAACTTAPQPSAQPAPVSQNDTSPSIGAEGTSSITIKNFSFSPNSLTVKAGEIITITNKDSVGHSFTSDDGTSFDTGVFAQEESRTVTAPTKPGTYTFHCTPHQATMTGTLIVTD